MCSIFLSQFLSQRLNTKAKLMRIIFKFRAFILFQQLADAFIQKYLQWYTILSNHESRALLSGPKVETW